MNSPDTAVVAYVASPHEGYLQFFRQYEGACLYVFDDELIAEFSSLTKHLPGNRPADAVRMIAALAIFRTVRVVSRGELWEVARAYRIVMPDEDVSRTVAEMYLADVPVVFDGRWRLRWYKDSVAVGRRPDGEEVVSADELDRRLMRAAIYEGGRSPDWWRQIGALLVRDGTVLVRAYNRHVPAEQSCYVYGDPRSQFGPGEQIELSASAHAERSVAAAALRAGICTEGCDLYVQTFPCPPCAYEWAETGIKHLFYSEGYSLVDGAPAFQANGVQIIRVLLDAPSPSG
ncbi:MAG: hypothetical protein KGI78_00020 [Patescibacteria group bacterium]|nr:hypothetical protein [Patescibacteria group bacterium]MDE1944469.1 hypothetical protein [Patescibacteria group bacterium]MDE2057223.1 hypothetical protein [Patescibacteria group bacterium]